MKIRSLNELSEFLDTEFAWRRRELTALSSDIRAADAARRAFRLRAGVALLYAHWEGFVKQAAEAYLSYVAVQRLRLDELSPSFLGLALRRRLHELAESNEAACHTAFAQLILRGLGQNASIPVEGVADTGANLNSARLKRIVLTLGLDYSGYELKEHLIDNKLLNWRNGVAHGREIYPDESEFNEVYLEITGLIRQFKDQVENAAVLRSFRAVPRTPALPVN